jgi:hypothetical protein
MKEMVEMFQCPGCVCGSDTTCGRFKLEDDYGQHCAAHVLGTSILGVGTFALGLPKGFNRSGVDPVTKMPLSRMNIRLYETGAPEWDHLNVPVWALEREGFLFVRTYSPRVNKTIVHVIKGGALALVPNALDVAKFEDQID